MSEASQTTEELRKLVSDLRAYIAHLESVVQIARELPVGTSVNLLRALDSLDEWKVVNAVYRR